MHLIHSSKFPFSHRRLAAALAISLSLLLVEQAPAVSASAGAARPTATTAATTHQVVWAVGDVCDNDHAAWDCADLATRIAADPERDAVLILGDAQYDAGTLLEYQTWYHPKMGALTPLTHPAPGNHDYRTQDAAGYFDYWGSRAGVRGQGYYAVTLGAWRLIAANSNCWYVGGCTGSTPQGSFIRQQIQAPGSCELVFAHHPVFSDGPHGDTNQGLHLFQIAYYQRAELYLAGHDHSYQRFAPRRPDGVVDAATGVRSFVVGTGGSDLTGFGTTDRAEYRQNTKFGALRLVLHPSGYTATFVGVGGAVLDSTSGSCRP